MQCIIKYRQIKANIETESIDERKTFPRKNPKEKNKKYEDDKLDTGKIEDI